MSKVSKKTGSNSSRAKSKAPATAKAASKPHSEKRGRKAASTAEPTGPRGAALADPRLPPVGTVIQKLDRHGNVRCECTVEEGGIRYKGELYSSLSASAMAAAKDLRLKNRTQNGFTFWGLSKPPGQKTDPVAGIQQASQIFMRRAQAAIGGRITNDNRAEINRALLAHAEQVEALRGPVAA